MNNEGERKDVALLNKVLIANQDEFESKGIQWLLESSFTTLEVERALTLTETIHKLESLKPDILILEIDLIGREQFKAFKRTLQITKPLILGITIEATFEAAKKAINLEVKDLFVKPLSPEILLRTVRKSIREMSSIIQAESFISSKTVKRTVSDDDLFIPSQVRGDDYTIIGLQTENHHDLKRLFSFLKGYQFIDETDITPTDEMIICIVNRTAQNVATKFKKLLRDWHEKGNGPVAIVIHSGTNDQLSLHEKYIETKKMMKVTFFVGYNQVLEFNQLFDWKFIDPFLTPKEQQFWIEHLQGENRKQIREWLYHEFLQLEKPYPEPNLLRIRLTSILAQIRRFMKTSQINQKEYEDEYLNLFHGILYHPLLYRIVQQLILFIANILDEKQKLEKTRSIDVISKSIEYIKANYWNTHLSLRDIALFVERNPSYLSSQIAKKTGKTYKEIVNDIRIRTAKKLLRETNMSVKEISALCGFNTQQHFNKVFRSINKQSPNQFRKTNT